MKKNKTKKKQKNKQQKKKKKKKNKKKNVKRSCLLELFVPDNKCGHAGTLPPFYGTSTHTEMELI